MGVIGLLYIVLPLVCAGMLGFAGVAVSVRHPDYELARLLTWCAAFPLLFVDIIWGVTTHTHWQLRCAASAVIGAAAAFACFEMLIWIDSRERLAGRAEEPRDDSPA